MNRVLGRSTSRTRHSPRPVHLSCYWALPLPLRPHYGPGPPEVIAYPLAPLFVPSSRPLTTMPPKRKAPSTAAVAVEGKKPKRETIPRGDDGGRAKPDDSDDLRAPHPLAAVAEEHGIVLRQYYPAEMSNARAAAYNAGALARPAEELTRALEETAAARRAVDDDDGNAGDAVVHWFKKDLRTRDNRALWLAGERARAAGVPLIGLYVLSPQDLEAHLAAPVRVDFALRSLRVLRADLAALGIPLVVETVAERRRVPLRILELLEGWGARHLYANAEYEVDELRREARLVRLGAARGIAIDVVHDTCVVPPGALRTGAGRQYAVYTPWYRAWVAHLHANPELLEPFAAPAANAEAARARVAHLFTDDDDDHLPAAPEGKRLTDEEAARYAALWPAGERAALDRLAKFAEERIGRYHERRNFPAEAGTSSLSVHLAAGTLSARTAVRYARDRNKTKKLDAGIEGIRVWISEVAWRDFYRHVLVNWPYIWFVGPPFLLTHPDTHSLYLHSISRDALANPDPA